MLEGFIIFNLSGSVKNSSIPDLVVGDNNSVKLKVKWLDHETIPNYKDLTDYVVEGVYTRPDGKVSPALTFSIDPEDNKSKYLVFGSWLTEIAGIAKLTVRFKQDDEIKATGQISLVIQDGSTPADVVITEPQHESLQEAIQAEENAREAAVEALSGSLSEKEEELKDLIAAEENARKQQDDEVLSPAIAENARVIGEHTKKLSAVDVAIGGMASDISDALDTANAANSKAETALGKANQNGTIISTKLNKIFDVSDANDIAEEDYFVINSGGNAYRISLSQLKEKIGNDGEKVVNNYLGDFNSEEELKAAYPVAQEGNFAYVKGDDEIYAMYLWVDEDDKSGWYKSTSGKYVKTTTFDSFKTQLQNGEINVGSIVANVVGEGNEEVLQTLKVNGKNYSIPSVSVDTAMSDDSTNPVQNKVIKEYVDNAIVSAISAKLMEEY